MYPSFEKLNHFSIIGCPQYGNPGKLCPGLAWDRLTKLREKYGFEKCLDNAYGVEVYPPDFPENDFSFYYMAGMMLDDAPVELKEHMFIKKIPAATYAVFGIKDNDIGNMKATFEYAYQKWLPKSEYKLSHSFDLERYKMTPEKCFEIMLPVEEK